MDAEKVALVAPLNWGLGHATRCIPIIDKLLSMHVNVHVLSDGPALTLLKKHYPSLTFHEAKDLNVHYPDQNFLRRIRTFFSALIQFRKFKRHILQDKVLTDQIVQQVDPYLIISDNRYGVYSEVCKSVLITHQLSVRIPVIQPVVQRWLEKKLDKFDEIWVPDTASPNGLSGILGHPKKKTHAHVHYIGPLSRFNKLQQKKTSITAIISGPGKPKQTFLKEVFEAFKTAAKGHPDRKFCIIYGGDSCSMVVDHPQIELFLSPTQKVINEVVNQSIVVVSRSGYSTIMDLNKLEIPGILVPTPGQYEQVYLSKHLGKQHGFCNTTDIRANLDIFLRAVDKDQLKPKMLPSDLDKFLLN